MIKKIMFCTCLIPLLAGVCAAQVWQAPDQEQARERAKEVVPFVREYQDDCQITRRSACHQDSFNPDYPERIGLKAAYHQQCMECHRQEAKGPVDCTGCHLKHVPDHKELVTLPDNPDPIQVTKACLECHDTQGEDMLKTAHWLWRGPSPYTTGHRKDILHGKGTTALNNF